MAGDGLKRLGRGAVIGVGQRHVGRVGRAVAPELDRAGMGCVVAAKHHHHRHQVVAGQQRYGDGASQPGRMRRLGALKGGAFKLPRHDEVPLQPGLAGQALAQAKAQLGAVRPEAGRVAVPAAAMGQACAVGRGHPVLHGTDKGFHGAVRVVWAVTNASAVPGPACQTQGFDRWPVHLPTNPHPHPNPHPHHTEFS